MPERGIIYCFCNYVLATEIGVPVVAMAADGTLLATHYSSDENWARKDIGMDPYAIGDPSPGLDHATRYVKHYPNGYELIWVTEPSKHRGVLRAVELNYRQALASTEQGTGVFVRDDDSPDGQRELTADEVRERGL